MNWLQRIFRWFAPSPATQYDMAANAMWIDGYCEIEIRLALGPRPEQEGK